MTRWLHAVAIGAIVLIAVMAVLLFFVPADEFRPLLESELTRTLNRKVTLGKLRVSLLSGGIAADDISIADDPAVSQEPFLRARSLQVSVDLIPLILSRKVNVRGVTIEA